MGEEVAKVDEKTEYPDLNTFVREEMEVYKLGGAYKGPWIVGWASCALCGSTKVVVVPVSDSHPLEVAMECNACGLPEMEFFQEGDDDADSES